MGNFDWLLLYRCGPHVYIKKNIPGVGGPGEVKKLCKDFQQCKIIIFASEPLKSFTLIFFQSRKGLWSAEEMITISIDAGTSRSNSVNRLSSPASSRNVTPPGLEPGTPRYRSMCSNH